MQYLSKPYPWPIILTTIVVAKLVMKLSIAVLLPPESLDMSSVNYNHGR